MLLPTLALTFAAGLEAKWLQVESGGFSVITDGSEKTARGTLEKLDLARRVFAGLAARPAALPLPVTAFALTSESRFQAIRPGRATRGFYQSGPVRDFIVLRADGDVSRIVFHEYVHLVLNHSSGPLPKWIEEGLAEFHSTLDAADGRVRIGRPISGHIRALAVLPWLPMDELANATSESHVYEDAERSAVFYAQSWALIHMLRLHEKYRAGFPEFAAALAAGEPQAAAIRKAFGKPLLDMTADLKAYVDRPVLPLAEVAVTLEAGSSDYRRTDLSDSDGDLAFAELAMSAGRPEEAGKVFRRFERKSPSNGRTAAALAFVALARKRTDEARSLFESAMKFPDADAQVFFEYAMLLRDHDDAGRDRYVPFLLKAVERNPQFAEAHFLIGAAFSAEKRDAEAIPHLERAARIFPRQSYFWHALAVAYHGLGRVGDSRRAAQRALESAAAPDQAEMARAALLLSAPATAPADRKPSVTVPDSWRKNEGDARAVGVLQQIDCLGASARFVVRTANGLLRLFVENPGDVLLKNLSSVTFEFRCGPQKAIPVAVEYRARKDSKLGVEGIVTAIEFP